MMNLRGPLEAVLFASGDPVNIQQLMDILRVDRATAEELLAALEEELDERKSGLMLHKVAGGYQLVTRPDLHDALQWVRTGTTELSSMALEVLAIVAFKQPITRAEIEKLRGVSSERVLTSLVQQGLVVELGRKDSPGRPILYGTSAYFLECIGMDSLADLAGRMPADITEDATDGRTVTESDE